MPIQHTYDSARQVTENAARVESIVYRPHEGIVRVQETAAETRQDVSDLRHRWGRRPRRGDRVANPA